MTEAETVQFVDGDTGGEAVAIVRYDDLTVALCLSLKSNGDIEVVMAKEDASRLLVALQKALTPRAV